MKSLLGPAREQLDGRRGLLKCRQDIVDDVFGSQNYREPMLHLDRQLAFKAVRHPGFQRHFRARLEYAIVQDWRGNYFAVRRPGDFPSGNAWAEQSLNAVLNGIAVFDARQLRKPASQLSTATACANERFSQFFHGE